MCVLLRLFVAVVLVLVLVCTSVPSLMALVAVPEIISSNMVLQRAPQSAVLWGTADSMLDGLFITVSLDGIVVLNTSVSLLGTWLVHLPPQAATSSSQASHTITISGQQNFIKLTNILFGDVWLCGGQSNMEFTLNDSFTGPQHVAQSSNYPGIRLFTMQKTSASTPQTNETSKDPLHLWGVSSPALVGGASWSTFSAVCYYYGLQLYTANLGEVPIGLVASNWGGTQIERWSSSEALAVCSGPATATAATVSSASGVYVDVLVDKDGFVIDSPNAAANGDLYNGMIYPILNLRLMGSIWYQGEANAYEPLSYSCRFPAMIADWRVKFGLPDLYFFFVQLAALPTSQTSGDSYPKIRDAQLSALALPLTGVALAIDLGDPTAPLGAIHPRNKAEVARRLFLQAWDIAYGQDVISTGAVLTAIDWPGLGSSPDNHTFVLHYAPGPAGQGLYLHDTDDCTDCCAKGSGQAFQIKTDDDGWTAGTVAVYPLSYRVHVSLSSLSVSSPPLGIRYAYSDYPECVLSNAAKLPSIPFQRTSQ